MLFRPPRIHVDTDFCNQTQCGRFVDTIDLGQIHAANPEGLFANRKFRLIAIPPLSRPRRLEFCRIDFRCQTLQVLLDLNMTAINLLLIGIEPHDVGWAIATKSVRRTKTQSVMYTINGGCDWDRRWENESTLIDPDESFSDIQFVD